MLTIIIIGCISGVLSALFIVSEFFEALANMKQLSANNPGFKKATILYKFPIAFKSLFMDVAITLSIVWLFSMGGTMTGMMISLMISGAVSAALYIRKKTN